MKKLLGWIARNEAAYLPEWKYHHLAIRCGRLWKTQPDHRTMVLSSQAKIELMGGKRLGFGDYEQIAVKKRTKREKFLAEMDAVVPWQTRRPVTHVQSALAGGAIERF
jgi:hypothetical protein